MDIHRSRFVPYPPASITSLAFSHVTSTNRGLGNDVRLAIGRANGDVEIWNPLRGDWVQEVIFRGGRARTVDGLAWIQEQDESVSGKVIEGRLRLFSIGYSSTITEWDLLSGVPSRDASGGTSAIWCMAPQPRVLKTLARKGGGELQNTPDQRQDLVAGCADGSLILFSTADNDLQFHRYITRAPTKKAQALCITFQDRNKIIAGYAGSFMRVYDIRNGSLIRNITIGAGLPGAPKETLVWQVKCLPSGDFISGSSNGEIQIWDGKTYSQRQRIAGHKADILALATSPDGTTIFSGGTDMRTVVYREDTQKRWAKVFNEKVHQHEVKALAAYQDGKLDVVVSGGIDASPIAMPIRHFGDEYRRALPRLPQQPSIVSSAPSQRLFATWWNREVLIWRIGPAENLSQSASKNWKLVSRLVMKSEENITSAVLSDHGKFLAVSNTAEVKLFQLHVQSSSKCAFRVQKIVIPTEFSKGARLVRFSPDGKWLAAVSNASDVRVGRIVYKDDILKPVVHFMPEIVALQRTAKPQRIQDGLNGIWGSYSNTLSRLAFSSDSCVLVAGDIGGSFDSWILKDCGDLAIAPTANDTSHSTSSVSSDPGSDESDNGDEANSTIILDQHWVSNARNHLLPTLDSAPLVLSFRPSVGPQEVFTEHSLTANPTNHSSVADAPRKSSNEHRLLVVTAKHQIYEFDILKGQLTDWSRRNPTSRFPIKWRAAMDKVMGCIWDIATSPHKERLWLYGDRWLFMFDLSRDFPSPDENNDIDVGAEALIRSGEKAHKGKKRKRGDKDILLDKKQITGAGGKVLDRDRPNLGYGPDVRVVIGTGKEDVHNILGQTTGEQRRETPKEGEKLDEDGDEMDLPRIRDSREDGLNANGVLSKTQQGGVPDQGEPHWWATFQYRSILGIVPIGEGKAGRPPEVVVVERPLWDLDLPPRFTGPHDDN